MLLAEVYSHVAIRQFDYCIVDSGQAGGGPGPQEPQSEGWQGQPQIPWLTPSHH